VDVQDEQGHAEGYGWVIGLALLILAAVIAAATGWTL
jgi:hypothetical protein